MATSLSTWHTIVNEEKLQHILATELLTPISIPKLLKLQGRRSRVFSASQTVFGVEVIIKLTFKRDSYPVERWIHHQYISVGVPAPQVLYYSPCLPDIGCSCLVMTKIDGIPLFKASTDHIELYREAGYLLGKMHSVPLPAERFGLGAFLSSVQSSEYIDWNTFVTSYHEHPVSGEYLRQNGLWPEERAGDFFLLSSKIAAHHFDCVINHGDFGPDHLLVDKQEIAGIIDPGEAFAGPPEYDLAYMSLYISVSHLQQLLRCYSRKTDFEMMYVYATVIALHKAARALRAGNWIRAQKFAAFAGAAYLRLKESSSACFKVDLPFESLSS